MDCGIAILGAGGMLGQAVVRTCLKKGRKIYPATRQEADISDFDSLLQFFEKVRPSEVINCAAYTDVDRAERERDAAFIVNARGPEYLGRFALEYGFSLVHLSTDYVFDGKKESPYLEEDALSPSNVYALSKAEGEVRLAAVNPQACILRTSWLFGTGGKNFVSSLIQLMKTHTILRVVDDQRGSPTYVEDLAEIIPKLLGKSGIYHFANKGALSRYQIALDLWQEALAKGIPVVCQEIVPVASKEFPTLANRPRYTVLNTNKVEKFLGIRPRTWEEVLKEYV